MKKLIAIAIASLAIASCATLAPFEHNQALLSRMKKPAIVISIGSGGILVRDARGHYWSIDDPVFNTLKPGDILR